MFVKASPPLGVLHPGVLCHLCTRPSHRMPAQHGDGKSIAHAAAGPSAARLHELPAEARAEERAGSPKARRLPTCDTPYSDLITRLIHSFLIKRSASALRSLDSIRCLPSCHAQRLCCSASLLPRGVEQNPVLGCITRWPPHSAQSRPARQHVRWEPVEAARIPFPADAAGGVCALKHNTRRAP